MTAITAQKGTVSLYFPKSSVNRRACTVDAPATIVGGLAIHRKTGPDGSTHKAWKITHIATGAAIMSALPYDGANKIRKGLAPLHAYVAWCKALQQLPVWDAWQAIMAGAKFGTGNPSAMGGRAVDLSRQLAQEARNITAPFGPGATGSHARAMGL